MKLYATPTSPYARIPRIAVHAKSLEDKVEFVWTKTRIPNDPMFEFNPSGRIPFLALDDGTGLEDVPLIIDYLDTLGGPKINKAESWAERGIQATAEAMLDGLCNWLREDMRPHDAQYQTLIEHESTRAKRLLDYFEGLCEEAPVSGPLNLTQLYLLSSLMIERRVEAFAWRKDYPKLVDWYDEMIAQAAVEKGL